MPVPAIASGVRTANTVAKNGQSETRPRKTDKKISGSRIVDNSADVTKRNRHTGRGTGDRAQTDNRGLRARSDVANNRQTRLNARRAINDQSLASLEHVQQAINSNLHILPETKTKVTSELAKNINRAKVANYALTNWWVLGFLWVVQVVGFAIFIFGTYISDTIIINVAGEIPVINKIVAPVEYIKWIGHGIGTLASIIALLYSLLALSIVLVPMDKIWIVTTFLIFFAASFVPHILLVPFACIWLIFIFFSQ